VTLGEKGDAIFLKKKLDLFNNPISPTQGKERGWDGRKRTAAGLGLVFFFGGGFLGVEDYKHDVEKLWMKKKRR